MTNDQRIRLEYFTQPDGAGESECFAQLFSSLCVPSERDGVNAELEKAFPKTRALIKAVMQDPNICRGWTQE